MLDFADQEETASGVLYRLKCLEEEISQEESVQDLVTAPNSAFHIACCFWELDTLWDVWREDVITPTCILLETCSALSRGHCLIMDTQHCVLLHVSVVCVVKT